jgi:hypothetical protein
VDALCALQQVIAKLPEFRRTNVRHGWCEGDIPNDESTTFLVESKLFAVPVGKKNFPDDIANFHPYEYFGSYQRLAQFLGRYL